VQVRINGRPAISAGQEQIERARVRFPEISANGIYPFPGSELQEIVPDQIDTALEFLARLEPTKTGRIGSGTLKHDCENWGGVTGLSAYVSRGALTVAALALGYTVQTYPPQWSRNPNVAIGVRKKDLRRIVGATAVMRQERKIRACTATE